MENLCNFSTSSRKVPTCNYLLKAHKTFVRFMDLHSDYVYKATGKENDTDSKAWRIVLVDSDKLEQFLEQNKTGSLNATDYGRLIISGYEEIPKEIVEISDAELFSSDFVMTLHPESKGEILYVLSDTGKKQEVLKSRSIEEIECRGTILYTANFLEPPESVSFNILKQVYLIKAHHDTLESTHMETNDDILEINSYKNGSTVLHQVSFCGNKGVISNLVRKGANIHKKDELCGRLPAHIAASHGDIGVLEFYLNNGISVNVTDRNGWTLLHNAVWNNNLEAIRFLIRNDSEIDRKDTCLGKTALHVSADQGHTEAVHILLENGAKIDEVDDAGRTALYYSAMAGCLSTAKFLMKYGANIHIANKYGNKALHIAASYGNKDVIECLINEGSHINNQNNYGTSPLHKAARFGFLDIVHLLVNQGANVKSVNIDGETPFDCGKYYMDVASFLAIKMIKMFQTEGNFEDAFKVCRTLLTIHGDQLISDQIETCESIFNLAKQLYDLGEHSKAFDILKKIKFLRNGS